MSNDLVPVQDDNAEPLEGEYMTADEYKAKTSRPHGPRHWNCRSIMEYDFADIEARMHAWMSL